MPSQTATRATRPIPAQAGVGLKAEHYLEILEHRPSIGWFEIHAENYMEAGGPPHHYLRAIREDYPLSVHGVGLSIGGAERLDEVHLGRLKAVCDRYQPGLVSEHLAWSTHAGIYLNDLLPVPYNRDTLRHVVEHIDHLQSTLRRRILLENPSTYVAFQSSDMGEIEFLSEIVSRTGCGLLLDVNNIFVASTNHGRDPEAFIDSFPVAHVGEIHLGGHSVDADDAGSTLLIDSHGCEVTDRVWELYKRAVERTGPVPTLIEWDNDVPAWSTLIAEARRADVVLNRGRTRRASPA